MKFEKQRKNKRDSSITNRRIVNTFLLTNQYNITENTEYISSLISWMIHIQ